MRQSSRRLPRRLRFEPRRCSPPRRSSSAAARSPRASRSQRGATRVASEIGDKHREWRALQALGEFGIASDSVDEAVVWLERALALARSERFEAAEAIGVHSLGVAHWILGDLASAESLVAESIELFRAREGTPDTIPSPLNIAEIRMSQSGGRPGLRHIFEDTLHPLLEISCGAAVSYALANQAGIARVRGDLDRARALLDESTARFEAARDDAGLATVLVRRAYISLTEGELGEARSQLEQALELRLSDRRGPGARPLRPRARRDHSR